MYIKPDYLFDFKGKNGFFSRGLNGKDIVQL